MGTHFDRDQRHLLSLLQTPATACRKWASEVRRVSSSRSRARGSPPTAGCSAEAGNRSSASSTRALPSSATGSARCLAIRRRTKKFDAAGLRGFCAAADGLNGSALRHVLEVRHDSFLHPAFIALLRKHGIAVVLRRARYLSGTSPTPPADFVYAAPADAARNSVETAYPPDAARRLGRRAEDLGAGRRGPDVCRRSTASAGAGARRATCSPSSSTRARCARRPGPWR